MSGADGTTEQSGADGLGLLLKDAVSTFADPVLVQRSRAAEAALRAIPPRPSWVAGSVGAWRAWAAAYDGAIPRGSAAVAAAHAAVLASLTTRLRSGELEGTGIRLEPSSERRLEPITPELWDLLELRPDRNEARGLGIIYGGVRIRAVEKARIEQRHLAGPPTTARSGSTTSTPPGNAPFVPRPRGRPSLNRAIRAELRRRADDGEMLLEWRPEARPLAAWVQSEYPEHKAPTFQSIERRLREFCKQMKADKKPG